MNGWMVGLDYRCNGEDVPRRGNKRAQEEEEKRGGREGKGGTGEGIGLRLSDEGDGKRRDGMKGMRCDRVTWVLGESIILGCWGCLFGLE